MLFKKCYCLSVSDRVFRVGYISYLLPFSLFRLCRKSCIIQWGFSTSLALSDYAIMNLRFFKFFSFVCWLLQRLIITETYEVLIYP